LVLEDKENLEKAKQAAVLEEVRLLEEQQQAILGLKAVLQQSEQDAKDLAEAKRMAEEERMNKLVVQEVKAQSVDTVVNLAELKQAEEDARKVAELSALKMKEKELADLERQAEIAKQQKEQEAFERDLEKARVELRLAVEKQEQEDAQAKELKKAILAAERARLDSLAEIESKSLVLKESEAIKTEAVVHVAAEQDSVDALTDAEIFKQTIARIEAQRKQKEEQVRMKSEQETAQRIKANEAKALVEKKAREEAMIQAKTSGDTAKVKELELTVKTKDKEASAAADSSALSAQLKSDANPNVYLVEMQKAELAIANDKKTVADKDYTLKPMPEMAQTKPLEPQAAKVDSSIIVKDSKIDEDRRIVDEYQAIAKVEEAKLAERIKQDREALGLHDQALAEELRQAERQAITKGKQVVQVAVPQVEKQNSVVASNQFSEPEKAVALEMKTEMKSAEFVVEPVAVVKEVEAVKAEPKVEAAVPISKVERTVVTEQNPVAAAVDATTTKTATQVFLESVAKLEAERKAKEQQQLVAESGEVVVAPQPEMEAPKPASVEGAVAPRTAVVNTVSGPAALRNYANRKPNFDAIENDEQRMLIQRMAAEDKGRIAVQKRLENAKMMDATTSAKLGQLQRSQDVIATMKPANAREEYQPQAFNRDALRKRKGVDYRIAVALAEIDISESVTEALSAELGGATSVSAVDLLVGHYRTEMDARAELLYLKGMGFENSSMEVQLDGKPISLEEVKKVLFVD
jgi:colicin import membrane protein